MAGSLPLHAVTNGHNKAVTPSSSRQFFFDILAALPQTQCTRCGYPDCAAYADAISKGQADINQCPPGGSEGVQRLAHITGRPALPLNPAHGTEGPRSIAIIDENWCIGCTLCIKACPTDAILGSNKLMHTVIESHCTGCELCLPVCPVDCISLENVSGERTGWQAWSQAEADTARNRYELHSNRYPLEKHNSPKRLEKEVLAATPDPTETKPASPPAAATGASAAQRKQAMIAAALASARAKRS